MTRNWVDKWLNRIKLNRISKIVIPVALVILVFFAGFTIYGTQVGNFVVNVDKTDPSIAVCMEEDESDVSSRIAVSALDSQDLATLSDIPSGISEGLGLKSDYDTFKYFAVSFYLVNVSERTVDYDVTMSLLDSVGVGLDIVRLMVIEGTESNIYAKAEESDEDKTKLLSDLESFEYYESTDFISDNIAFAHHVNDLYAGQKIKYTVVIWMEGCDKLAVDGCEGSRVKMQMDFVAY